MVNCKWCDCPIPEGEEEDTMCRKRDGDLCEPQEKKSDKKRKLLPPDYRLLVNRLLGEFDGMFHLQVKHWDSGESPEETAIRIMAEGDEIDYGHQNWVGKNSEQQCYGHLYIELTVGWLMEELRKEHLERTARKKR